MSVKELNRLELLGEPLSAHDAHRPLRARSSRCVKTTIST
jgi:hypothetical protein